MSNSDDILFENSKNEVRNEVGSFLEMLADAISIAKNISISNANLKIDKIIFSGMGGSGIVGKIIKSLLIEQTTVVEVVDDQILPAWADEKTLFVPISYSGNTYETLANCQSALNHGCHICAVSSGGELEKLAKEKHFFHLKFNRKCQPRSSFPYLFILTLKIIQQFGLIEDVNYPQLTEKLTVNKQQYDDKAFVATFDEIFTNDTVIFYGNGNLKYAALRAKTQINENSKSFSSWEYLTESNHNAIEGLRDKKIQIGVILFDSKFKSENEHAQTEAFISLLKNNKLTYRVFKFNGADSKIEEMFMAVLLADYISYYLADQNGYKSMDVKNIAYIKEVVKSLGEK